MEVLSQITGTVLISESDLEGGESGDGPLNPYDEFRKITPVAILQDGVYVYQGTFAVPLAAALVDVRRSGALAREGRAAEALAVARRAAALAPESARTRLQLASMLASSKQWAEAREHYQLAQQNLLRQRPDLQQEELDPQIQQGMGNAHEP